ncbi:hypothetical protein P7C73_g3669, partial [Tremellales sp. Uapishka_1]
MVYPPPPPQPGAKYQPGPLFQSSTASPDERISPMGPSPSTGEPQIVTDAHLSLKKRGAEDQATKAKGTRKKAKTAKVEGDEVAAGLALTQLGKGATWKKEEKPVVKRDGEKDARKSCSECRRLKAKCDRQFPCSNCRRRGCALVCPDGDLSCMQGKRLVLASTEQLHERISLLETALFQSHSKLTPEHHPLLAPEYLDGGFASVSHTTSPPVDRSLSSPKDRSSVSSVTLVTPQLSVSSQGRMAVESLLVNVDTVAADGKREDEWAGENAAPAMIVGSGPPSQSCAPISLRTQIGNTSGANEEELGERKLVAERLQRIVCVLPSREECQRRSSHFWDASCWYQTVLQREEFDSIYEPSVYAPTPANPLSPHKLACVLMVLTLDCYLDISTEEEIPAISEYWNGAQECFDTRFGWASSVAGVQALALMTHFVGFGWRGASASNFHWLRLMTSAYQQLGLHKDPHSSLPEDEREFRRKVFHDAFVMDCLISLTHGQRIAVPLESIETAYPRKVTPLVQTKYDYMRLVKTRVIDLGLKPDSNPATEEELQSIEKVISQFNAPNCADLHCSVLLGQPLPSGPSDPAVLDVDALTKTNTSLCHYKALMFLYRPSLRRLIARMRNRTVDTIVFNEAERQTVAMTYKACNAITMISMYIARTHPRLAGRLWHVWIQTFSAAVSVAALAIWCGPNLESSFIDSAYKELTAACEMIKENGSKRSMGVLSLLPLLQSLVSNRYPQVIGQDPVTTSINFEGEDMLFALLGGQVDQKGVLPPAAPMTMPVFPNDPNAYPVQTFPLPPIDDNKTMFDFGFDQQLLDDMSATELWARFQTYYEPTPAQYSEAVTPFMAWGGQLGY